MNITADKKADLDKPEKAAARSYRSGAFLLLFLAGLALALSLPRLIGGLHALGAEDAVSALLSDAPPPPASTLETAAAELATAERWAGTPEYSLDRGLILLRLGLETASPEKAGQLLAAAEQATAAGLAQAPAEPGAWARLAWLRQHRGDLKGALAALRMSWLSGAFVPAMMTSRLEFALALQNSMGDPSQNSMDDEMLSLLRRQIRLAWVVSPDFVAKLAERPAAGILVQEALNQLSENDINQYIKIHGRNNLF